MNGAHELMKILNYIKKKLNNGMIKEFINENSILVIKFFYTSLLSDILHINSSKWGDPYIVEEVYCSGAIKINNSKENNLKVVNGQKIKHHTVGIPLILIQTLFK